MKRLTRELLYGEIRTVIQIVAGIGGWLLQAQFGTIGMVIAVFTILFVIIGLEVVRSRRFRQLYAERMLLTKEEMFMKHYLPGIILGIIVFVILFPLGFFTGMNFEQPMYVLVVAIGLWPEFWLAHRRYQAD